MSEFTEQLDREFRPRAVDSSPGGEFYLSPDDMLELIDRAESIGLAVIGMEAFLSRPPYIQPYAYNDYDVGSVYQKPWPRICEWCANKARRYVNAWRNEANAFAFSIVDEEELGRLGQHRFPPTL